jgi:hypothetical protein
MKHRLLLLSVVGFLAACSSPNEPPRNAGALEVVVRFSDGAPASAVVVEVGRDDRRAVTNEAGVARFSDVAAGPISVTIHVEGAAPIIGVWQVAPPYPATIIATIPLPVVHDFRIAWRAGAVEWGAPESLRVELEGVSAARVQWLSLDDAYRGDPALLAEGAAAPTAPLRPGTTRVEARYVFAGRILARDVAEVMVERRDRWNVALEGFLGLEPGSALDLSIADHNAVVARGVAGGISVVDLRGAPAEIGRYTAPGLVTSDVDVQDDIAFLANEGREYAFSVAFVDISDPFHPMVFSGIPQLGACGIHSVALERETLITVERCSGSVRTVDISDLRLPRTRRFVGQGHDIHLRSGLLFVATPATEFQPGRVQIRDVSNITDPIFLAEYRVVGHSAHTVWLAPDGRHLFVVMQDRNAPVLVLDVFAPASPRIVGRYQPRFGNVARKLRIRRDGLAFLTLDQGGVEVIDVTNPTAPRLVGFFVTSDSGGTASLSPADEVDEAQGAWGVHWADDGRIVVTDAGQGLFVLRYSG